MEIPITEIVTSEYQVSWLPWAVQYFFLIGISYSALMLTIPGLVFNKANYKPLAYAALFVALATSIVAPISLFADLHQPGRFWHFYAYASPSSWMWLGALFLPVYVTLVIVYAWLAYRPELIKRSQEERGLVSKLSRIIVCGNWEKPQLTKILGIAALVLGLLVALYTGAEVMIVKARPLWHTYALPLMFMITAMTGAAGMTHILNWLNFNNSPQIARQLNYVLVAFSLLAIILGALWMISGAMGYSESANKAISLLQSDVHWRKVLITEVIFVLLVLILARRSIRLASFKRAWIIGLIAMYGSWLFRWMIFIDVQRVPKYGTGTYSYGIPLGHEGLLGIIGSAGLLIFLFVILSTLVPWKSTNQ